MNYQALPVLRRPTFGPVALCFLRRPDERETGRARETHNGQRSQFATLLAVLWPCSCNVLSDWRYFDFHARVRPCRWLRCW